MNSEEITKSEKIDAIHNKIMFLDIYEGQKYILEDKAFLRTLERYLKTEMNIKLEDIAYEILMDENPINSLYELIFLN